MLRLTGIFRPLLVFVVAFGMFLSAFTAGNASTTVREIEGNYITTMICTGFSSDNYKTTKAPSTTSCGVR